MVRDPVHAGMRIRGPGADLLEHPRPGTVAFGWRRVWELVRFFPAVLFLGESCLMLLTGQADIVLCQDKT